MLTCNGFTLEITKSLNRLPNPLVPLTTAGLVGSWPLRDLIAQNVTEDLLARVAAEHRKGAACSS